MREASSQVMIELLCQAGAKIQAFDPVARMTAPGLTICDDQYAACENADGLLLVTEWDVFRNPNFELIKKSLRHPVIFDGRNIYDAKQLSDLGIDYYAIGRGNSQYAKRQQFETETI